MKSTTLFFKCLLYIMLSMPLLLEAQTTLTGGNITNNTTWTKAASPYIIENTVTVKPGVLLTIQPGVIIKFTDHYDHLSIEGRLVAQGNSTDPIIFTSLHDDTHGGDTNGNGNATTPAPDQWGAIWFGKTSGDNVITYAWIGYGGGYATSAMINATDCNVRIENSTIAYSAERGLFSDEADVTINGNHFSNNGTEGIYFQGLHKTQDLVLNNNTFTNNANFAVFAALLTEQVNITLSENTSTGSAHNGFGMYGTIHGNMQWKSNLAFPFIIWDDVTVQETGSLSIYPNAVVKFNDHYDDLVINGSFQSMGISEAPIYITSLNDDTYGGDTNGDGAETQAGKDQWGAIWFNQTSSDNLMQVTYIGHGGGYATSGMINMLTSDVSLINCTVANSAERGVFAKDASPTFQNCNFVDNGTEGIYLERLDKNKDFVLENNAFTRNTNFAAYALLSNEESNITLLRNASTGSAHNGFGVSGTLAGAVQWQANEGFPFVIWDDVTVHPNSTLSIAAGSTVKFNDHYDDIIINGTLKALGTATYPVHFTALADDSFDGDTNGDGATSQPAANQWGAILLNETSVENQFTYTYFGYGGGYATSAMFNTYNSDARFMNCTFSNSAGRGVYANNASPTFQNCNFINNTTDGIYFDHLDKNKDLILENNSFIGNSNFAILAALNNEETNISLFGNTSTGSAHNGFGLFGTLNGTVQWLSNPNFPFVIWDDVTIHPSAQLNIAANTTIKFNDHYDDIIVNGSLTASGTTTQPVTFTALADDSVDGDTNGDAAETLPEANQWGAIWLNQTSTGNQFTFTNFGFGGGYATSAMLNILNSDANLQNCHIHHAADRGIFTQSASPIIYNCSFDNNVTGLYMNQLDKTQPLIFENNTFSDNTDFAVLALLSNEETDLVLYNNSSTGSAHNGFAVAGTVAGTLVWTSNPDFPFIIWEDVTINEFAKLTISEGSTLKFNDYYDDLIVNGALQAAGLPDAPVTFTSLTDDSIDGDTNGDGDATTPAPDQWGAIWFNPTSNTSGLDHSVVSYGGGYNTSAMINILQVDDVLIQNSTLMYAANRAVYFDAAYSTLELNRIHNNSVGIFTANKSLPALRQNDIYDNSTYGIQNGDYSVEVDAWNTWWGDPTGPEHPTLNPNGKGNPVSDHVLFQPWMNQSNTGLATNVENPMILPFAFENVTPNPFTEEAQINFRLTEGSRIRLDVYDAHGQLISHLLDNYLAPGQYEHWWNAKNLPAGYYWLRLQNEQGQIGKAAIKR